MMMMMMMLSKSKGFIVISGTVPQIVLYNLLTLNGTRFLDLIVRSVENPNEPEWEPVFCANPLETSYYRSQKKEAVQYLKWVNLSPVSISCCQYCVRCFDLKKINKIKPRWTVDTSAGCLELRTVFQTDAMALMLTNNLKSALLGSSVVSDSWISLWSFSVEIGRPL